MHENRSKQALATGVGVMIFWWTAATMALCQVAVYDMNFEREDSSINFAFFDGGLLVLDGLTGSGSFVFTFQRTEDNRVRDLYLSSANTAETFTAIKKGTRKAVVRATAETSTGLAHYLAIGEHNEWLSVNLRGQQHRFEVAPSLRGYVLASDDESDVDYTEQTETLGFAGLASMKLSLNRTRSQVANQNNQTVAEVISDLIAELEDDGFESDSGTDTTETNTTTDEESTTIDTTSPQPRSTRTRNRASLK